MNASIFEGASNVINIGGTITAANEINNYNYYGSQVGPGDMAPAAAVAPLKPNSSAYFTGREDILDRLKTHFGTRAATGGSKIRRSFLLYGMGGIGKTQICLKFTEEMEASFSKIFWIDASSENTILLCLKGIAANPDAKAAGVDGSPESVLQWLQNLREEWLMLFDNADLGPEVVEKFIPPGVTGNILITGRNGSLKRLTGSQNAVQLNQMEEKDAISLLLKAASISHPSQDDLNLAKEIVSLLYCLPLAVDQAGSFIESGLCNIKDYKKHYTLHHQALLSDNAFRGASKYNQTVYGTWEVSYSQIAKWATEDSEEASFAKSAISIIQTFAFCHHSNIGEKIFQYAAEHAANWNPEAEIDPKLPHIVTLLDKSLLLIDQDGNWDFHLFRKGIQMLLMFSLIRQTAFNQEYSVHPLVHSWSRDRFSTLEQQHCCLQTAALISCSILPDKNKYIAFRQSIISHVKVILQNKKETKCDATYYDDEHYNLGLVCEETGNWEQAIELKKEMIKKRTEIIGLEHPDTLTSMGNLASTYWNQGKHSEAEKLQLQILEIRTRVLGSEHPSTLTSMGNLASTYWNQGKHSEAEKLELQVLEIRTRFLGSEHPSTLTAMNNLASTYWNQGKHSEAEKLKLQVLEIMTRVLGSEHPFTLTAMNNLAPIYENQGKHSEAEKLQLQVLEIRTRMLGSEHSGTLTAMNNLASTYGNQGKHSEAEQLQLQVLKIRTKVLGSEHPDTLTSMGNLASIYGNQGKHSEAEKLELHILKIRTRVLGSEHPFTLTAMNNLASTYWNQGKNSKAEKLQLQVLEIRTRVLGSEHPDTLTAMNNLASTYCSQGKHSKAEKLQLQVLEIRTRVLGSEHPSTLTSMGNLASIYGNQGKHSEAEKLKLQVLEISTRVLGSEHPDTLIAMNNFVSTYWNQGKYSEAEKLELQILEISTRVLGLEHPDTLTAMNNLASTYWNQDKHNEAEKLELQVFEIRTKVLGSEHPDTVHAMINLAYTLKSQSKDSEAFNLLSQASNLLEMIFDSSHPTIITTKQQLSIWSDQSKMKTKKSQVILDLKYKFQNLFTKSNI